MELLFSGLCGGRATDAGHLSRRFRLMLQRHNDVIYFCIAAQDARHARASSIIDDVSP